MKKIHAKVFRWCVYACDSPVYHPYIFVVSAAAVTRSIAHYHIDIYILLPYFILSDFSFVSPFHFMCFFKLYVAQLIVPFYYLWKLHCIVKTMVPILNMIDLLGNLSFIFFTPRLRDTFGNSVLDFFSFDTISQHQKFEYFMFFRY